MEPFISYWIRDITPNIKNNKWFCIVKNKQSIKVLIQKYCSIIRGDDVEFPPSIVYTDASKVTSSIIDSIAKLLLSIAKVKTNTIVVCDSMFTHNTSCYETDMRFIKQSYIKRSKDIFAEAAEEVIKTGNVKKLEDLIMREINIYNFEFK